MSWWQYALGLFSIGSLLGFGIGSGLDLQRALVRWLGRRDEARR